MFQGVRAVLTYLMECMVKLQPISEDLECELLKKIVTDLTQQMLQPEMTSTGNLRASTNSVMEMTDSEKMSLFRY